MKSWRGTYFHLDFVLSCVTLRTPSITLANLDLIYFKHASASNKVSKLPTDKKVSVAPIRGVLNTSPNAPEPFDLGINTLYL